MACIKRGDGGALLCIVSCVVCRGYHGVKLTTAEFDTMGSYNDTEEAIAEVRSQHSPTQHRD